MNRACSVCDNIDLHGAGLFVRGDVWVCSRRCFDVDANVYGAKQAAVRASRMVEQAALGNQSLRGETIMAQQAAANAMRAQQAQGVMYVTKYTEVLPSVERLARAIFDTDERVICFASRVSECYAPRTDMAVGAARWRRAMDIAWERNEQNWRGEAELRAAQILERLK